jgi:hypothetical protein
MRLSTPAAAGLLAAFLGAACRDAGTNAFTDEAAVTAALQDDLGAMMSDSGFGASGAVSTDAPAAAGTDTATLLATPASAPAFWGRIRVLPGGPRPVIHKDLTVIGDSAWATLMAAFQGVLLVDTSDDGVFNPTAKPLAESSTQQAVLVRDPAAMHHWRTVLLSPRSWNPTAADRQTVRITDVQVYRNGTLVLEVTNPDSLYDVGEGIPQFHLGDAVRVVASVANSTGGATAPGTFVFLHVRHASPTGSRWIRVAMQDNGDGSYERSWTARREGRDRFVVDAIDAATLVLGTVDNYRANEVGIPFRIE